MKKLSVMALAVALMGTMLLTGTDANAWTRYSGFTVNVTPAVFTGVTTRSGYSRPCMLHSKVHFNVHNWVRRYTKFRAKVDFYGGSWTCSGTFYTDYPGAKFYSWTYETQYQGCWASRPQKASYLTVTWCYGRHCRPRKPFYKCSY